MSTFKVADIIEAVYISRPNRFVVHCDVNGSEVSAYLPNPGRLLELLLPGVRLYLEKVPSGTRNVPSNTRKKSRKLQYTVVAVKKDSAANDTQDGSQGPTPWHSEMVMLHTHATNDVAEYLLKNSLVPHLHNARIVKREAVFGKSRFDFLLEMDGKEIYLEVKSCTLYGRSMAMFPDAPTVRGRKHIEELASIVTRDRMGAVLFIVSSQRPDVFLPDYHTDMNFAKALLDNKDKILVNALGVSFDDNMGLLPGSLGTTPYIKSLNIPWEIVEREAKDSGVYLVILKVNSFTNIKTGNGESFALREGYYIYVGSAIDSSLDKKIKRYTGKIKKPSLYTKKYPFGYIDYLCNQSTVIKVLPIRTGRQGSQRVPDQGLGATRCCDLGCAIAKAVSETLSQWNVIGFIEANGCRCESHLFGMTKNPLDDKSFFYDVLHYFRMDRFL